MILLKNGRYLTPEGKFVKGDILIDGEKIAAIHECIKTEENFEVIELDCMKVVPGLIDIHFHGAVGHDVMAASSEELCKISKHLVKEGTTAFLPTTITAELEEIENAVRNVRNAADMCGIGASIEGVHIEGPFISPKQKGCHEVDKMISPKAEYYNKYKKIMGDLKVHITVAPEIDGAMEFINYVSREGGSTSIGHSDGNFDTIQEAIAQGANIFTHLFNCLKGLHHREPGGVGTALLSDAYVELICDGIHVHPGMVNMVYRLKGKEKIVLVTDAMQAAGLGDGEYFFGGFTIKVDRGIARKEDGTLASSTLSMWNAVKNIMNFAGIPLEEAVQMASTNPAKAVDIYDKTGSIEAGKRADLLVVDDNLSIKQIFCKGKSAL
ncbi:MAG: N-acetylglucosamine-6-phosphate deacetylase [Clostridia bacterium]|nr:N-acetylglucosamine-6-phosphate deacetylase [Clostridia bacterium]